MTQATEILGSVGGTSLVELKRIVPAGCARVLVKVESENPTGSMKDRMALSVIDRAVRSGRLPPSGTVVEYTGGSTGTSLAFVCAARGFSIAVVTSDAFSQEKRDHMRALGADVVEIASADGRTTEALIRSMMEKAAGLSSAPGTFFADQFNNLDAAAGYAPLAEEVWTQSHGEVDAFVQSVGTAQCIRGVAGVLRGRKAEVEIVAVEPAESAVLSGGAPGAHKIEGVGPGFVPPLWTTDLADEVLSVSTSEAREMTRRLARDEALFAGTSSGANVVAALRVAERLGPGKTVVTLLCDSGLKYLSTDLYSTGSAPLEPRSPLAVVNLKQEVEQLTEYWSPRVVGRFNDQYVKVAKLKGDLTWHKHDREDEMFLILKGDLVIEYQNHKVKLSAGDVHSVPKGALHNPVCREECWVALVETVTTQHTGDTVTGRTKSIQDQLTGGSSG